MPEVEDARDAENLVRSTSADGDPEMFRFKARKQGDTWIVTYNTQELLGAINKHEVHIEARTGNMLTIK
jgi:hypothetical protein